MTDLEVYVTIVSVVFVLIVVYAATKEVPSNKDDYKRSGSSENINGITSPVCQVSAVYNIKVANKPLTTVYCIKEANDVVAEIKSVTTQKVEIVECSELTLHDKHGVSVIGVPKQNSTDKMTSLAAGTTAVSTT